MHRIELEIAAASRPWTGRPRLYAAVLLLLLLCGPTGRATAQQQPGQGYTIALRGTDLDGALETFVQATGRAVVYDPSLVRGRRAYCVAQDQPAEAVLRCILAESGLDFYRLSSGTYVLTLPRERPPQPGFLSGTVTDRETGVPLADAHVLLAGAGLGSLTNRAGQFIFPTLLPGRYVVRISHIGYETWQDTLDVRPEARLRAEAALAPEPIFITPVVVDGHAQRLGSALLGRERVEAEGPSGRAGPPVMAGVGALPGVRLHDATADVHVQGGAAGAHELRLDGVPVYLPRTTVGLIGPFSAFAIGRVTVEKAGFEVAHGSHAGGVIRAEHAIEARNGFDVQVDPLSLNSRLQLAGERGGRAVAFMAAGRVGLWNMVQPPRLSSLLNAWSAPDPFLVLAAYGAGVDSLAGFPGGGRPGAETHPDLQFADLHAATRVRLSPLRTIHASVFHGAHGLRGGVLSREIGRLRADHFGPAVSVVDDYRWRNSLAQVRYDAVLGSRTLVSGQLSGSRYRLAHDYEMLDTLVYSEGTVRTAGAAPGTTPVQDGNEVRTVRLEAALDHARDRHHLRAGLDAAWTESAFSLSDVRFRAAGGPDLPTDPQFVSETVLRPSVRNYSVGVRLGAFASDRFRLTARLQAEGGVRLTYLPDRATVYAEPRVALTYDGPAGPLGPWSLRTAAGLYRQYLTQVDVSRFNAGAMLPSVRVWLPVDETVRPPLTYHLSQAFLVQPTPRWSLHAEGYYKHELHALMIRYAPGRVAADPSRARRQEQFLASANGHAYGASASVRWQGRQARGQALYEYSRAVRRSAAFFGGRAETVPWNEPHRLELGADWLPSPHLTLSARAHGVWGRAWGFRLAYYDYFGHSDDTRRHPPFDFGRPSDHVLPAVIGVDVGVAYTRPMGRTTLQLRLDVRNALDRRNVADWRLIYEDGALRRQPRLLYPRLTSVAARLYF